MTQLQGQVLVGGARDVVGLGQGKGMQMQMQVSQYVEVGTSPSGSAFARTVAGGSSGTNNTFLKL